MAPQEHTALPVLGKPDLDRLVDAPRPCGQCRLENFGTIRGEHEDQAGIRPGPIHLVEQPIECRRRLLPGAVAMRGD
jgi:hypothetical protein